MDVVVGAVIFSLAIGTYYKVDLSWRILLCLSITIWLIYTFDHLLDAGKITKKASTYRHQFHQKHKQSLSIAIIVLLIIVSINCCYLPITIIDVGIVGVFFSLVYFFLLQKKSFWAKEFYIATVYTFGIVLSPVCLLQQSLQPLQVVLIVQVFMIVFSNLLIFSWFDFLKDKQDGHPSMIIHLGIQRSEKLIKTTLAIGVAASAIIFFSTINEAKFVMQVILITMNAILIMLFTKDKKFRKNDLYRIIGDGIFFIPLMFILYAKFRQL